MKPIGCKMCSANLVTLKQSEGHWKWYKMVEVSGAYKHDRHDNSLHILSNIKVFATQDGWPAEHNSLHRSI